MVPLPNTDSKDDFGPVLSPRRRAGSLAVTGSKPNPTFCLPDDKAPSKSSSGRLDKVKKDKKDKSAEKDTKDKNTYHGKKPKNVTPSDGGVLLNLKRRASTAKSRDKDGQQRSPNDSPPRSPREGAKKPAKFNIEKTSADRSTSPQISPRDRKTGDVSPLSNSPRDKPTTSPRDKPTKSGSREGTKKSSHTDKPEKDLIRTSDKLPEKPEKHRPEKIEEDQELSLYDLLSVKPADPPTEKPVKTRGSHHTTTGGGDTDKDKNSRDASSRSSLLTESNEEDSGEEKTPGSTPKASPMPSKGTKSKSSKSTGCESGNEKETKPKKEAAQHKKLSATARFFGKLSGKAKKPKAPVLKDGLGPTHHYVTPTYQDLPDKAKHMINTSKLDKTVLTTNYWPELLLILSFITKDSFRAEANTPLVKRSERTPYASELFFEKAMKELVPITEKDLQKLYRHMEFSAKGGFGRVFSARYCPENEEKEFVAIKRLPHASSKQRRNNHCELSFLMHCTNHPNIVNYKRSYILANQSPEMWIVTEFMEGGTLDFAIRVHKFRERHLCYIAGEVLNGLVHLHELGFAHRDLKSANVMMSIKGEVKIIDFGLCCDFHAGPRQQSLGSPYWIPPEMLLRQPHHTPVDIWSYGILLLEMILGHPPNDHSRLACMMRAVMGTTLECIDPKSSSCPTHRSLKDPSKPLVKFLGQCLVTDQTKRATAKELAKDPWLKGHAESKEGIDRVLQAVFISNSLQLHGIY